MTHNKIKVTALAVATGFISAQLYAAPYNPVVKLTNGEALSVTPKPVVKVGQEYEINGVKYKPTDKADYDSIGLASWYGEEFQGKLTSNGEVFDMEELTAAHNTLALPSIVEVTNLENGKKVIVRVNDRGPFSGGRTIDLSKRAAELLGFKDKGTAKVRVTLLKDISDQVAKDMKVSGSKKVEDVATAPTVQKTDLYANAVNDLSSEKVVAVTPKEEVNVQKTEAVSNASEPFNQESTPSAVQKDLANLETEQTIKPINLAEPSGVKSYLPKGVFVQIGAFSNENEKVKKDVSSLSEIGVVSLQKIDINGKDILRLRVGPYGSIDDALKIKNRLIKLGYADSRVIIEQ